MRHLAAVLFLLPAWSAAQTPGVAGSPSQASTGNCSPNIVNSGSGPVTVQLIGSCNGIDPRLLRDLTQSMQKFLAQFPKTIGNLNELLDKKNVELAEKVREVEDWTKKYGELSQRLEEQPADDELSRQAADALKEGNLNRAEALLKELLAKEEKQVDRTARNHFNLALAYDLQLRPLLALPEYEKAYQYRPQEFLYAFAYAAILSKQNRYPAAEPVYLVALRDARDLPKDSAAYLPGIAMTLNNLGALYSDTQRLKEAEGAYTEVLAAFRQLAKENAAAYLPDVARTLNNLGLVYTATQRLKEAEAVYTESLATFRQLVRENAATYLPNLAMALNNLGNLYRATQRLKEAEGAYIESLAVRRQLAKENPAAYLPDVAGTLNCLGVLYSTTQRLREAEAAYTEGLTIRRQLAKENAEAYLPDVAGTLSNLGVLYVDTQRLKEAGDAYTESLAIRRQLAKENPAAYLLDVADTLSNLGFLYRATQRQKEAEDAYTEALSTYRQLAKENGVAYLPDVASTLNSLGVLYGDTKRPAEAEKAFSEGLAVRRRLAEDNPAAYLLDVATTLHNLGLLYAATQRPAEAEQAFTEGLAIIRRELAKRNPSVCADDLARSLLSMLLVSSQNPAHLCALAEEAARAAMSPELRDVAASLQKKVCEAK